MQASEADGQIKEPTTEKVEEWSKVARDLLINVERETKVLEHLAQKRVKFEVSDILIRAEASLRSLAGERGESQRKRADHHR